MRCLTHLVIFKVWRYSTFSSTHLLLFIDNSTVPLLVLRASQSQIPTITTLLLLKKSKFTREFSSHGLGEQADSPSVEDVSLNFKLGKDCSDPSPSVVQWKIFLIFCYSRNVKWFCIGWIFLDLPRFSFITGAICGTVRLSWEITKGDRRGRDKRLWACKCTAEVRNGLIQARCSPCWLHDKIDATWIVQNHVMRRKNRPEIFLERAFFDASHVSRETMEYRLIISRWSTIVCIQEERGRLGK